MKLITMPQPPYSPDMAPCDFFLFPKIKRTLKGRRFTSIDDIKSESVKELKAITKIEFQKCFEDWKKRWHKCIISEGDYFEGDKIDIDE
jgi:histone-lysine N-methyltransferase SETMAR